MTVLIINHDEKDISELVNCIEKGGFRVYCAKDELGGLRYLRSNSVKAVVTPLDHGRLEGIELIRTVRSSRLSTLVIAYGTQRAGSTVSPYYAELLGADLVLDGVPSGERVIEMLKAG